MRLKPKGYVESISWQSCVAAESSVDQTYEAVDVTTFWKTSGDITKTFLSSWCLLVMEAFSCKLCHNETNLKSGSLPVNTAREGEVV